MTERIKIFSHNDLDGFGAPYLLQAVQETVFPDTTFDIDNIGAGRIDEYFDHWLHSPEAGSFTDVYIMDMTPDSEHTFQELNANFANHWLNHLDDETKEGLKRALQNFPGNLILVSHEQSFTNGWLDKVLNVEKLSLKK